MKISKNDFDLALESGALRLALVGMSNSGKSTVTRLLAAEKSFGAFEVDEAINQSLNLESMEAAAKWMGYPFDERYASRRKEYLDLESQSTQIEIPTRNFVLDTTGSVIYTPQPVQAWLRDQFLIIGLQVSNALMQQMISDYFSQPKTVIWGDEFQPLEGESGTETLVRCYPELLAGRAKLYSELADVMIPAALARDPNLTAAQFLSAVRNEL